MDRIIANIPKNRREEIRVALSEFASKGTTHDMISARVFYAAEGGERKPGRNGVNLPIRLLPALVEALQAAKREARAAGLLLDEADADRAVEANTILGAG